jgi:hypothetical protein
MPKVCFCVSTKIDKESPAEVKIASRRYPRRGELRAMRECQSREIASRRYPRRGELRAMRGCQSRADSKPEVTP